MYVIPNILILKLLEFHAYLKGNHIKWQDAPTFNSHERDYIKGIIVPHTEMRYFIKKLNSEFEHFAVNKYIIYQLHHNFMVFYFFLQGPAPVQKQST